MWCPSSLAKLVPITSISMVYGYTELLTMVYRPTYNWGAPHCMAQPTVITGSIS